MAHFRSTIQALGKEKSLCGSKDGMVIRVNGWGNGVKIVASHENGKDIFRVYSTNGSDKNRTGTEIMEQIAVVKGEPTE